MADYKLADEEFQPLAKQIFENNDFKLNVQPQEIVFLRTDKNKDAYAYTKMIHGEYELLTKNKKYFIVIINQNFDPLPKEHKMWVILHEYCHCHYDEEKNRYRVVKHNIEDFSFLLKDPGWNLQLVDNYNYEPKENNGEKIDIDDSDDEKEDLE